MADDDGLQDVALGDEGAKRFFEALQADPTMVDRALEWQRRGRVLERFGAGLDQQLAIMADGKSLIHASNASDGVSEWRRLNGHVEGLWKASVASFDAVPAVATFLAITTMEEVAKLSVARFAVFLLEVGMRPLAQPTSRRRSGFFRHSTKHLVAATAGALVNARMRRLYGTKEVETFLADAETGGLVVLREQCLYADSDGKRLRLPEGEITPAVAAWYVAVAGELLAEVQVDPGEWERITRLVDKFRQARADLLPAPDQE